MSGVNDAALPTTIGKQPAGVIPLAHPITSFAIPRIVAECEFDETDVNVIFGAPEEIQVVHPRTKEKYRTCRVSVSIDKALVGYIPLPLRYRETWLELSYSNVLYYQMWELWIDEEEKTTRKAQKAKCTILRKNTGTVVAQHSMARLLAIEELLTLSLDSSAPEKENVRILDEWRIRWCRDWLSTGYTEAAKTGAKFLNADPIHPQNHKFFESDWCIDDASRSLICPPDDLTVWFNGEIDFLEEKFNETLKSEALNSLKKKDAFIDTQFVRGAVLPSRWHEGQQPLPNFWLVEQWDWIAEGNSMWDRPTHLLFHVLKAKPALTYAEFKCILGSIMKNVRANSDPSLVDPLATSLWMGEKTWRKFAKDLLTIHLRLSLDAVPATWETIDPANPFNTVEARLLLQGYLRRVASVPAEQRDLLDETLWEGIARISMKKYEKGWIWVVREVAGDKIVQEVLDMAGGWWSEREQRFAAEAKDTSGKETEGGGAADKDKGKGKDKDKDNGVSQGDHDVDMDENAGRSDPSGQAAGADGGNHGNQDDHVMGDVENNDLASSGPQTTPPPPPPPTSSLPDHHSSIQQSALSGRWEGLQRYPYLVTFAKQFIAFLEHQDIDLLESDLKADLPTDHYPAVKEFVGSMEMWLQSKATEPPYDLVSAFFHRQMAARARSEAVEAQGQLL
ncbi:hypothetical protein BDR05DRAFT_953663 [Suillus weaverae]|nr:hypothetical protein BDR05DRAFT_953663 [Suillus weaverae]